jgi:iron(III) transport system substrate-binding protein
MTMSGIEMPDRRNVEDRVVVYSTPEPDFSEELFTAFRMRYPGIKIEYSHKSGGLGFVDLLAEMERGENIPDVMLLNGQQMEVLKRRGLIDRYESPESVTFPERAKDPDPDRYATQVWMVPFGIAYNTEKVTPDQVPVRYEDLWTPQWRGKLLYPDPRASGSGFGWFAVMKEYLGKEFFSNLAKQRLRCQPSPEEELVKGQYPILLAGMVGRVEKMKKEGKPVDWVPIPVMCVMGPFAVIFQKAKHPNLGRLLIDFFLSAEGQQIISLYHIPNRPNVPVREKAFDRVTEKLRGVKLITFRAGHGLNYHENQAEAFELLLGNLTR